MGTSHKDEKSDAKVLKEYKQRQDAEKTKSYHDPLDDALNESFPASDPPSPTTKGTPSARLPHEKDHDD